MTAKIFINYRRDDVPGDARGVRDGLAAKFGKSSIFMDVDNLLIGQRFDVKLAEALDSCDILVAVLGPHWMELLKAREARGDRDYVREEIAAALKRRIVVVPVRIGREGAMPAMPRSDELPEDIREFTLYQKHDVAHERFGRDIAELIDGIIAIRKETETGVLPVPARAQQRGRVAFGLAACALAAAAFVGAHSVGLPVPWPGAPPTQSGVVAADAATRAKAEEEAKARSAEVDALRAAAAKAEDDRKRIEAEAAKLRAETEARRRADAETKKTEPERQSADPAVERKARAEAALKAIEDADDNARRVAEVVARGKADDVRRRLASQPRGNSSQCLTAPSDQSEAIILACGQFLQGNPQQLLLKRALNRAGLAYSRLGLYQEAVANFDRLIGLDKSNSGYFDNRQGALRALHRYDQALRDANETVRLSPELAFGYHARGNLLSDMGRLDEAVADLTKAYAAKEAFIWSIYDRGGIFIKMGRSDLSIQDFTTVIRTDGTSPWPYRQRAMAYLMAGNIDQAKADLETFLQQQSGEPGAMRALNILKTRM